MSDREEALAASAISVHCSYVPGALPLGPGCHSALPLFRGCTAQKPVRLGARFFLSSCCRDTPFLVTLCKAFVRLSPTKETAFYFLFFFFLFCCIYAFWAQRFQHSGTSWVTDDKGT